MSRRRPRSATLAQPDVHRHLRDDLLGGLDDVGRRRQVREYVVGIDRSLGSHVVAPAALSTQSTIRPQHSSQRWDELGFRGLDDRLVTTGPGRPQTLLTQDCGQRFARGVQLIWPCPVRPASELASVVAGPPAGMVQQPPATALA